MPQSFIEFLNSSKSDTYVAAALQAMKESPDRYTNALHTLRVIIEIPHLEILAERYKKLLLAKRKLDDNPESKETKSPDAPSKKRAHFLATEFIHIACHELLDANGDLDPIIIQKFKLGSDHTAMRNKLISGFAHYVFMEMLATKTFQEALKEWMQADHEWVENFIRVQAAIDADIREQLKSPTKINDIAHYFTMRQQLVFIAGPDSTFTETAVANRNFYKYANVLEYAQTAALQILAGIQVAAHNVMQKFKKEFEAFPTYETSMSKIISELTSPLSTALGTGQAIDFPKLQRGIEQMRKLTETAKTTTEIDDLFSFFRPTDDNIKNIKSQLDLLAQTVYVASKLHKNPTARASVSSGPVSGSS